jgi:hypothetical protein
MASSCALDEAGLRLQLDRYRRAGRGASLVGRTSRRLVVELDQQVDTSLVEAAIAVERECCRFFSLDWLATKGWLIVSVAEAEHEPALDGIAFALGVEESAPRIASECDRTKTADRLKTA